MYTFCGFIYAPDLDIIEIRDSKGKHAHFIYELCSFYKKWHLSSDGLEGMEVSLLIFLVKRNYSLFMNSNNF